MKRFILTLSTAMAMFLSYAQTPPVKVFPKTIQVTGIAELNIAPDEIHVMISLKEYEKKGKGKMDIESIQKAFLVNMRKAGLADSAIRIISLDGSNGTEWWRKKAQKDELFATVTYEIVVNDAGMIEDVIARLDDEATHQFFVSEITHTKLQDLQKQLRMDAVKAAKTKATYLAEAISESIGSAITINETTFPQHFDDRKRFANTAALAESESVDSATPEFKKMTLRSEMNVVFELK